MYRSRRRSRFSRSYDPRWGYEKWERCDEIISGRDEHIAPFFVDVELCFRDPHDLVAGVDLLFVKPYSSSANCRQTARREIWDDTTCSSSSCSPLDYKLILRFSSVEFGFLSVEDVIIP